MPLLTINDKACLAALQKKADLLASTASNEVKLDAAEQVANQYVSSMVAVAGTQQHKPKPHLDFMSVPLVASVLLNAAKRSRHVS